VSPHFSRRKNIQHGWHIWFGWRQKDIGRCAYCGVTLLIPCDHGDNCMEVATLDHIHPRSRGGHATVWACLGCNRDKMHLTLNEWRMALSVRRRRIVVFFFEKRIPSILVGIARAWVLPVLYRATV
jgi:hypothetical protein